MSERPDLAWQPSLLDDGEIEVDPGFAGLRRRELAEGAWVDHVPGWCHGADALFAQLLGETPWRGRDVRMYDRTLREEKRRREYHPAWIILSIPPGSSAAL